MHSGFVYPGNQCDRVAVKLGKLERDFNKSQNMEK